MQYQDIRLSRGKDEALLEALITCRPLSAAARSESWSIGSLARAGLGREPGMADFFPAF